MGNFKVIKWITFATLIMSSISAQDDDIHSKREALKNQFITDMDELKAEAIRLYDESTIYDFTNYDYHKKRHFEYLEVMDEHYMQLFKDIERGRFDKEL